MKTNNKKIAFGGLLLAMFCIVMYLDAVLPVLDRSFLILGSFFVMVAIIETGFAGGLIFYVSAVILGILILPVKSGIIFFGVFFGLYALEKYFAELIPFRAFQFVAKIIFANLSLAVVYFVFQKVFMDVLPDKFQALSFTTPVLILIIIGFQALFLFYDYLLSAFAIYYYKNLRKKIKLGW